MVSNFASRLIRATSAYSEGQLNELKTRILYKYESSSRIDKLFIVHWRALKGAALIGSSKLINNRMILNNLKRNQTIDTHNLDVKDVEISSDTENEMDST